MIWNDKLSLNVIYGAVHGDRSNIDEVLAHYDRYINSLCIYNINDPCFNYKYIDEFMKSELKRKLILEILKFNI